MKVLAKTLFILTLLVINAWQAQAENLNEQAKQALSLGRVDAAADLLSKQVQSEPSDYQAWFLLGVAQARGQHFHRAIEAFRRVIELRSDLAEPHNNLAVIYNELGDVKAAVHELEQSLQKHPGYAIAEENIADLYVKLALQYYKKALLKNENPALTQRYARLLQVRDPSQNKKEMRHVAKVEKPKQVAAVIKNSVTKPKLVAHAVDVKKQGEAVAQLEKSKEVEPVAKAMPVPSAAVVKEQAAPIVASPSQNPVSKQVSEVQPDDIADVKKTNKANESDKVLTSVEAWRSAWQAQDLEAYFAAYANDYAPTGKYASLAAWKAYKKRVIGNKSYIKVNLSNIHVDLSEDKSVARVRFNQAFRSNSYNGDDVKVLKLEKRQQGWKIVREASISS